MSASYLLTQWEKRCNGTTAGSDPTLPDNTGNCADWKINQGRYDPRLQMPPSGLPLPPTQGPITAFFLENRLSIPVKLYYRQNGSWITAGKPMIRPGEYIIEGNAYLADDRQYKVVDADMNDVATFQVIEDKQHVVLDPKTISRPTSVVARAPPKRQRSTAACGDAVGKNAHVVWIAVLIIAIVALYSCYNRKE